MNEGVFNIVCSVSSVRVGSHSYYTEVIARDDYYKDGGEARGAFFGKGAERLGLTNREIGKEDSVLRDLFLGISPDGDRLRTVSLKVRTYEREVRDPDTGRAEKIREESKPVLGWDFTFSAPKSVSVLWSQASPEVREKIEACQRTAVREASTHLERFITVRTGRGGVAQEKADPIFAAFQHGTSRALDPQLHTHVVLVNTGIRESGKGGALDARSLFKERFQAGQIYRNALERELRHELQIETVRTTVGRQLDTISPSFGAYDPERKYVEKAPSFEVKGVPRELLHEFSKRSQAIEKALEKTREPSFWEKQSAALVTRDKKEPIPREKLFYAWKEVGRNYEFDWRRCLNRDQSPKLDRATIQETAAKVSKKLSFAKEIDDRKIRSAVLTEEKGRFSASERGEFIGVYKETYLSRKEIKVEGKTAKMTYALNPEGLKAASWHPEQMSKVRSALQSIYYTHKRVTHSFSNAVYRLREMSFAAKMTYLYATHRISRKTYERVVEKKGEPRSRLAIEWKYATYQISRAERSYLLKKHDPERKREALRREETWVRRTEEKKERVSDKERRIDELQKKGLVSDYVAKEARAGRISLSVIERDLRQRGKLARDTPCSSERLPRVTELSEKELISDYTARAIDSGRLSVHDAETYLRRCGKLSPERHDATRARDSPEIKDRERREEEKEYER